jgi:hypothetical protein
MNVRLVLAFKKQGETEAFWLPLAKTNEKHTYLYQYDETTESHSTIYK